LGRRSSGAVASRLRTPTGDDGENEPLDDLRAAITVNQVQNFRIVGFGEGYEVP